MSAHASGEKRGKSADEPGAPGDRNGAGRPADDSSGESDGEAAPTAAAAAAGAADEAGRVTPSATSAVKASQGPLGAESGGSSRTDVERADAVRVPRDVDADTQMRREDVVSEGKAADGDATLRSAVHPSAAGPLPREGEKAADAELGVERADAGRVPCDSADAKMRQKDADSNAAAAAAAAVVPSNLEEALSLAGIGVSTEQLLVVPARERGDDDARTAGGAADGGRAEGTRGSIHARGAWAVDGPHIPGAGSVWRWMSQTDLYDNPIPPAPGDGGGGGGGGAELSVSAHVAESECGNGAATERRRQGRRDTADRLRDMIRTAPLVECRALDDDIDPAAAAAGKCARVRRCRTAHVVVLLAAVAAVAALAAVAGRDAASTSSPEPSPSPIASAPATERPTDSPVTARFDALRRVVVGLNVSAADVLSDPTSPQRAALSWLADEDALRLSPEEEGRGGERRIVQRYAMAVLYHSTGGADWRGQGGYLSERHECNWTGVVCDSDGLFVEEVILDSNGLNGKIPEEIGALSTLRRLILDRNRLSGPIPDSVRNLGESIQEIKLNNNYLTGSIPDFFMELPNLTILRVAANSLSGALPQSLNRLRNLTMLEASQNSLTGTIPLRFEALPALEFLSAYGNALSGTIPPLDSFTRANVLALGNNLIGGALPEEVVGLSDLLLLGLWDMQLTGTIPPRLFDIEGLVAVGLGGNNLTGTIPENVGRPESRLRGLTLERNRLTGTLPASLGEMRELQAFVAHSNALTGTIPSTIGNVTSLMALELANNKLTGSIPEDFSNLVNLDWLSLSRNDLRGSIDFLCDLSILIVYADCKGSNAEVECGCCKQCCIDNEETPCGTYGETDTFLSYCFGEKICNLKQIPGY